MAPPRVIFVSAVLISLLAPSAEANRFFDNPEFAVDRVRETWTAPIGELEAITAKVTPRASGYAEERRMGTGFLISPCYVLTAHHVVYGDDITPEPGIDYRMKFRAGTSETAPFAGNTTATPVTSGFRDDSSRDDWALLRLTNCIGKKPEIGWLETSNMSLPNSKSYRAVAEAVALGYPADKNRGVLDGGRGELTSIDPRNGLRHFTGSFASGESGGPVVLLQNDMLAVYALIVFDMGEVHRTTYAKYTTDRSNLVQSVYEVVNRPNVKAMLDQDKAAWGLPNPNLPRLRLTHLPQPR